MENVLVSLKTWTMNVSLFNESLLQKTVVKVEELVEHAVKNPQVRFPHKRKTGFPSNLWKNIWKFLLRIPKLSQKIANNPQEWSWKWFDVINCGYICNLGIRARIDQHGIESNGCGFTSIRCLFWNTTAERFGSFYQRRWAKTGPSAQLCRAQHRRQDAPRRHQGRQPIASFFIPTVFHQRPAGSTGQRHSCRNGSFFSRFSIKNPWENPWARKNPVKLTKRSLSNSRISLQNCKDLFRTLTKPCSKLMDWLVN